MVLDSVFLSPLGLVALLATVPVVVLYLIRPDPRERELPTMRFLSDDRGEDASNPVLERLSRNLLLLLQLAAIILLATSLATPYTLVSESSTVEETVIVVDGSASMTTEAGGATRFDRAVSAARDAPTSSTSVVFVGRQSDVRLRDGTPGQARTALDGLTATDTAGDLPDGIAQASAIAGENARVVVFSDFADDGGWADAVEAARARGLVVELRQFGGGGDDNVGIIDQSFAGNEVTLTVKNYGDGEVERTLSLGDQEKRLTLGAGDVVTRTFAVPTGGGTAELSGSDSFATDDAVTIAAPEEATIEVLVLTNDRNEYLTTALSVIPAVDLTVESPPTNVETVYDVVVYSNIEQGRLLRGNVEDGEQTLEQGGGVVVQAQRGMPNRYPALLPVEVGSAGNSTSVGSVAGGELTRDISFPPPEEYLTAQPRNGTRTVVGLTDGTPLVATAERGEGRVLYFGYLESASSFKYNYQYPVFWKRAMFSLAGRQQLTELNQPTGEQLQFDEERTVQTPGGEVTAAVVPMDQAGFYRVGDRRFGASLTSESESAVATESLDANSDSGVRSREEERQIPNPLTEWVVLGALVVAVGELGFLRKRGDL